MKIIKEGITDKILGYRVTCEECGCVYEIKFSETEPRSIQGGFTQREWRCPTCDAYQSDWQGGHNTFEPITQKKYCVDCKYFEHLMDLYRPNVARCNKLNEEMNISFEANALCDNGFERRKDDK